MLDATGQPYAAWVAAGVCESEEKRGERMSNLLRFRPKRAHLLRLAQSRRRYSKNSGLDLFAGASDYDGTVVDRALLTQAKQLDPADRLELIGELWQSLNSDELPVTAAERTMLDERLADLSKNPDSGRPWKEVEADLQRRLS